MRPEEQMIEAQRTVLLDLNRQLAGCQRAVLNLMNLLVDTSVSTRDVMNAIAPALPLANLAALPTQEQGPGHTEPMETDLPLVDEIRSADPHGHPYGQPTEKLPTLAAMGLADVEVA